MKKILGFIALLFLLFSCSLNNVFVYKKSEITAFSFTGIETVAEIDSYNKKIIAYVPYGTDITSLSMEFEQTGLTFSVPSGAKNDFTNPFVFQVTNSYASVSDWTVITKVSSQIPVGKWVSVSEDKTITLDIAEDGTFSFSDSANTTTGTFSIKGSKAFIKDDGEDYSGEYLFSITDGKLNFTYVMDNDYMRKDFLTSSEWSLYSETPVEPVTGNTITGTITLPDLADGKNISIIIDTDTEGGNGSVAVGSGTLSGTTYTYSIDGVADGNYYIYAVVNVVSETGAPQTGDFFGAYGITSISDWPPSAPNSVVSGSTGSTNFDFNLFIPDSSFFGGSEPVTGSSVSGTITLPSSAYDGYDISVALDEDYYGDNGMKTTSGKVTGSTYSYTFENVADNSYYVYAYVYTSPSTGQPKTGDLFGANGITNMDAWPANASKIIVSSADVSGVDFVITVMDHDFPTSGSADPIIQGISDVNDAINDLNQSDQTPATSTSGSIMTSTISNFTASNGLVVDYVQIHNVADVNNVVLVSATYTFASGAVNQVVFDSSYQFEYYIRDTSDIYVFDSTTNTFVKKL